MTIEELIAKLHEVTYLNIESIIGRREKVPRPNLQLVLAGVGPLASVTFCDARQTNVFKFFMEKTRPPLCTFVSVFATASHQSERRADFLERIPSRPASSLNTVNSIRQTLKEYKVEIDALVEKHHGISVSLFGSVARGEETGASDIDFLVDFEIGSSLFDLLHLQEDLQELLGRKVDVVSSGGLKSRDDHIRREAVSI